jgi:hypothetical protein
VTSEPPPLAVKLAAAFDRIMWDVDGPMLVALRALGEPAIAEALTRAPRLDAILALHQPRPWGGDSSTVSCTCGAGSYDGCPTGRAARGEQE